ESRAHVFVGSVLQARKREAVPGRAGNEIERAGRLELGHEARQIGERFAGGPGAVEKHAAVVEPTKIDAHRPRVDADDARHRLTASAPSTPARRRRWSRRPARGRCARTGAQCTPYAPSS